MVGGWAGGGAPGNKNNVPELKLKLKQGTLESYCRKQERVQDRAAVPSNDGGSDGIGDDITIGSVQDRGEGCDGAMEGQQDAIPVSFTITETVESIRGEEEGILHHVTVTPSVGEVGNLAGDDDFLTITRGPGQIPIVGNNIDTAQDDVRSMNTDDGVMISMVEDDDKGTSMRNDDNRGIQCEF